MRGIEVIILQGRGKPLLSQSTSDKELSVTPNNRYSKKRGSAKKRGAHQHFEAPSLPIMAQETRCLSQWLFWVLHGRNWPTRTHGWHVAPLCPLLTLREHFSCHLEAPGMKMETVPQFRDRESLVSLQKKT